MLREDLEDCLFELPPSGTFQLRSLSPVGTIEQPVRKVEAVDSVYPNGSGLAAPIAGIYAAHYLDGSTREIFVLGNPTERDFVNVFFLKDGRKTDQLNEIRALIIDPKIEAVPKRMIDLLVRYEADRDRAAAALQPHIA